MEVKQICIGRFLQIKLGMGTKWIL